MKTEGREIKEDGEVVGIADRIYAVEGDSVTFDEVVVKRGAWGDVEYNGYALRVNHVHIMIGLEVTMAGPRGPVWKGVVCSASKIVQDSEEEKDG